MCGLAVRSRLAVAVAHLRVRGRVRVGVRVGVRVRVRVGVRVRVRVGATVAHHGHDGCGQTTVDDSPQDLRLLVGRALPQRLEHELRRPHDWHTGRRR